MRSMRFSIGCFLLILFFVAAPLLSGQSAIPAFLQSEQTYFDSLISAGGESFARDFEYPFLAVIKDSEKKVYESIMGIDERKHYMVTYWRAVDPNPLLEKNDALADFRRRYAYVKEHFTIDKPPYFDDRGKYWFRYGEPSQRYSDPGGVKFLWIYDVEDWEIILGFVGRGRSGSVRKREWYSAYPNETWTYQWMRENGDKDELLIHFVKRNTFKEVTSLEDAVVDTRDMEVRVQYWIDLFKDRIPALASTIGIRSLERAVDHVDDAIHNFEFENPDQDIHPLGRINRSLRELNYQKKIVEQDALRERTSFINAVYEFEDAVSSFSLMDDVSQFRNVEGGTDLFVTLYTPLTEFYEEASIDVAADFNIGYSALLRDRMFNPIVHAMSSSGSDVYGAVRAGLTHAVGDLRFALNPQEVDVTFQIEENATGRIGFSRRPFEVRDFGGTALMLSDIRFYSLVGDYHGAHHLPVLEVLDTSVTPYPFPEIGEGARVMCYFEIYNLITGGVVGAYEVTMRVKRDDSNEGVFVRFARLVGGRRDESISVSHVRPVERDTERELVGVDFANLDPGRYVLEVTVRGQNQEYLSASTSKNITLQ